MKPSTEYVEEYAQFQPPRAGMQHIKIAGAIGWLLQTTGSGMIRPGWWVKAAVAPPEPRAPRAQQPADDHAEILALKKRVQELEARVRELTIEADEQDGGPFVEPGPHARWIESHLDELRKYPDCVVVLDPERGIVFHSKDEDDIEAHVMQYGPEEYGRLMIFRTSMYV